MATFMMSLSLPQSIKTILASIIHFDTRFPCDYLVAESHQEDDYPDEQVEEKFGSRVRPVFRARLWQPLRFWNAPGVCRRCFSGERRPYETRCRARGRRFFCNVLRLTVS